MYREENVVDKGYIGTLTCTFKNGKNEYINTWHEEKVSGSVLCYDLCSVWGMRNGVKVDIVVFEVFLKVSKDGLIKM